MLKFIQRSPLMVAGILLLIAGALILMGIITSESKYPSHLNYTTHNNEISDLGATRQPGSISVQPSASIFNTTMVVTGLMTVVAAFAMRRAYPGKWVVISTGVMGVGILGVGIFPGNYATLHPIFALMAFSGGGISAILSSKVSTKSFGYIASVLGAIALIFLFLNPYFVPALGKGGAERWIAYPVTLWMVAFGAYMLGSYKHKQ